MSTNNLIDWQPTNVDLTGRPEPEDETQLSRVGRLTDILKGSNYEPQDCII